MPSGYFADRTRTMDRLTGVHVLLVEYVFFEALVTMHLQFYPATSPLYLSFLAPFFCPNRPWYLQYPYPLTVQLTPCYLGTRVGTSLLAWCGTSHGTVVRYWATAVGFLVREVGFALAD